MLNFLRDGVTIPAKRAFAITALFALSLSTMELYSGSLIEEILRQYFTSWDSIFFGKFVFWISLSVSQIVGSILADRVNRRSLLMSWTLLGIIVPLISIPLQNSDNIIFFSFLLGATFGFGLPSSFAAIADYTQIEERGRISGVVQFTTFFLLILSILIPSILGFGLVEYQILCIVLRCLALIALFIDPFERKPGKSVRFLSILKKREFLLFTIPWLMFNLSNGVLVILDNILKQDPGYAIIFEVGPIFQYIGALLFGITSGVMADRIGRKQPLIIGFVILGISYALVGVLTTPQSLLTMISLSGIGWGSIMVVFLWTILGDISPAGSRERYYALGFVVPTLFEALFQFISANTLVTISAGIISSTLSVFLFLSVVPLMLAKETLPEEKIGDRKLRDYLKKIGKLLEDKE
jgi:MFS family permease